MTGGEDVQLYQAISLRTAHRLTAPVAAPATATAAPQVPPQHFPDNNQSMPLGDHLLLTQALELEGSKGCLYRPHSFRRGTASTAAAIGYVMSDIRAWGHWYSACYKHSVRPLPDCYGGGLFSLTSYVSTCHCSSEHLQ
ncbi:hypothetical protein JRQ81_019465, partial [Phrynocephalus forsythii]